MQQFINYRNENEAAILFVYILRKKRSIAWTVCKVCNHIYFQHPTFYASSNTAVAPTSEFRTPPSFFCL